MTPKDSFNLHDLNGVSKEIKLHLAESEIYSIKDIAVRGEMNISEATGLSPSICKRICSKARSRLEQQGILCAPFTPAMNRRDETISFGSKNLNELLGGRGVHTGSITEIFGESNAGKTQVCHMLCVMVQLERDQGGLDGKAIYIDTESSFTLERIHSIAKARGLDKNNVSKNVIVATPMSSSEQEHYIERAGRIIDQCKNPGVKLLVVDSVTGLYRADYIGRAALPQRQQRLYRHMLMLKRLSEIYGVAVVVTNQVNEVPDPHAAYPYQHKPIGGNVMAHSSTYRIRLGKEVLHRMADLTQSPYLPEKKVWFNISAEGVYDVPDPKPLV